MSPPTREAWIETAMDDESASYEILSPPTREAWIEIAAVTAARQALKVASHPGGVD